MHEAVAFVVLVACNQVAPNVPPEPLPPSPPPMLEGDFRGTFDGAELYLSLDACSGTAFYARIGVPIALSGTCSNGEAVLHEQSGNKDISTITLRFGAGGWDGEWQGANRRGRAHLEAIGRAAGEAVFVAKRRTRVSPKGGECPIDVDVPTPLGIADRAFEHRLQDELRTIATSELEPVFVCDQPRVTYAVHDTKKGFFGVVFTFAFNNGAPTMRSWAVSVAVDDGVIAKRVGDLVDESTVRPALRRAIDRSGWSPRRCVAWEDGTETGTWDALDGARGAAVSADGLVICRPMCIEHSHLYACYETPYANAGPLHAPFDRLR